MSNRKKVKPKKESANKKIYTIIKILLIIIAIFFLIWCLFNPIESALEWYPGRGSSLSK